MLTIRPAKRSPRVLAIRPAPGGFAVAVIDPWEVRTLGVVHARGRSDVHLAVAAALTRERPSVLAVSGGRLAFVERAARLNAESRGVPVVAATVEVPSRGALSAFRRLYPGADAASADPAASDALALATSVLLALPIRHRSTHASHRHA